MTLSKNVINKKCVPKFVLFNEKKIQRDSDDFLRKKIESQISTLFDPIYTNSQSSIISFDYSWFLAKKLLIFYPSLENSTTGIAILGIMPHIEIFGSTFLAHDAISLWSKKQHHCPKLPVHPVPFFFVIELVTT